MQLSTIHLEKNYINDGAASMLTLAGHTSRERKREGILRITALETE
jgi:hypothetical protein